MSDDEKRLPGVLPEMEGTAPAPASAPGTATAQNTLFTSNNTTDSSADWRRVSLVSNIEGEYTDNPRSRRDGYIDEFMRRLVAFTGVSTGSFEHGCPMLDAPDAAWPLIVGGLMDFCVRGQEDPATRAEFMDLFDLFANRVCVVRDIIKLTKDNKKVPCSVTVAEGYVPLYNREHATEGTGLSRAPADAVAYAMAVYDAEFYEAKGFRQVVVKGSDDIAEYSPTCNDDDTAPYAVKTHRELERQFHHWGRHLGQRQLKRYLEHLRDLLPEVDFTEELDAMECPIGNGMLRRDFSGGEVTLHVRPYTADDYRLGKYAGLRFDTDANGEVIPPEEPVYRRDGFPDWRPGEWLRDVMADEDGRRVLRAVLVLFLFPAVNIEKAVVFYSPGRSGKGTYLAMMRAMVGPKQFQQRYLASVGLEKMGQEYYLARLVGKVANLVDETEVTYLKKMADAKKVLGGDVVTGRDPYGKAREFIAKMLHVICINSDLSIAEQTDAIFGRFLFVVFRECFLDRPGGIDRRIKEDFMQRPQTLRWFAYDAIANTPYFETSSYLDENSYVISSNEENWAESNPTMRAWRLLREEVETSGEDGPAKWAGVRAMPVCVAHALMSSAKERYEGEAGKLPRQNGRTFRSTLERAAKADGFVLVRNKDGTPKQFPMAEWWVEDDMKPLMDALGDEGLRSWVRAHAKARPRAWLVRRDAWERYLHGRTSLKSQDIGAVEDKAALHVIEDAGMDAGAAREALDSFERDLGHIDIRIEPDDEEAFSDDELGPSEWFPSERFDRALRERYGRLKGEAVVASRAPGGYELWLNPWAATFDDRNPTGNPHFSFPVPSGASPRDELEHVTLAPVVERHVERDASWEEVAGVIEGAVREAREGEVRVCVTAPTGVAALPSFGEWIKLPTRYTSWLVRPVSPPVGGSS